jgi:Sec-independent protein translocase protein TatA
MKLRTLKKEMNEIKKIVQDMKEEFNKDMESLKKKRNKIPGNKKLHKSNEKYS